MKVVQEDDQVSGGSGAYLPKSNFMSIVTSPQYQQIQQPQGKQLMSRERNGKIILNNAGSRNYGIGSHQLQVKEPLKLVNVYSNVQQKRQAAQRMLNKQSSQDKLQNNSIIYSNRKPMEQRYKSHLRGQDIPGGMIRN